MRKNRGVFMEKGAKKKTTTKKVATKKPAAKKKAATKMATPEIQKVTKKKTVVKPKINQTECRYCYHEFDDGIIVCPHCKRSQKDKTGMIVIAILSVILVFCLIANYFIDKHFDTDPTETQYKERAPLVSYEDMINRAATLRGTNVSVRGVVTKVDGEDTGESNLMTVTMNINMFEDGEPQPITFDYEDMDFSSGIMVGKIMTVFGEYTQLNGSTPHIEARFVEFGK